MLVLVMYESMFGNSERVARMVAEGLGERAEVTVRDVSASQDAEIPDDVGLLVVGGPTHALSMSRPNTREDAIRQGARQGRTSRGLREWLSELPRDLESLPFATFDTRVSRVRRLPGSAAHSAARILRRRHGRIVVPPESFYVTEVAGSVADGELERARAWGVHVTATVLDASGGAPGSQGVRRRPRRPSDDASSARHRQPRNRELSP